jgi:tetratricopeptide (TPR) repeat protein
MKFAVQPETAGLKPGGRRVWLFRLSAMLLIPALLLLAAEISLRICGYGYNPHFFVEREIGGERFLVQNEDFSRRFFPPEIMRQPDALRMRAKKSAGTIRIFIFGESAAMGDPEPAFGPARYFEALLQERFPRRNFEVVNVSFTAINSHVLLPLARECASHDGDLWIIYMGNNEMVGPYGAATVLGKQAPPRSFVRLVTTLQRTRLGQLAMALTQRFQRRSASSVSWGGMAMFQKQRLAAHSPRRELVYKNFSANLNDMLRCGVDSGAGIILNTIAVNLHDSPPFASMNDDTLPAAGRMRFDELFQNALRGVRAGDWTNAANLFGQALEIDAGFAEAHYRRAMCLEKMDQLDAARREYQLACDTDALPFRSDSRENELIRESATRHLRDRFTLVDAANALAKDVPGGICGQDSFYEHVHFNFDGSYRLGLAWARAVAGMFPKEAGNDASKAWATQEICNRHLGLTDLNRSLIIQSVIQRLESPPLNSQFDNATRMQRLAMSGRMLASHVNEQTLKQDHEMFGEALAAHPEDHYLLESFAVFLQATGDLNGAIREWQKVGELLPHDFLPEFEVGSILAKQGKFPESESHLRKSLGVRPRLVEGWNELGQCLGAQEKWGPALAAFERACELKPEEPVFWAFRAKVLTGLKRQKEAIECYQRAVKLNPAYAEAHAALGDQYAQAGKIPEAIAAYQAAIGAKQNYTVAHVNLGLMFAREGKLDEAVEQLQLSLALEPGNSIARDLLKQVQAHRDRTH